MDTKTRPMYMLSTRNPLQTSRHIQTESERGWENIFHANGKQNKAGGAILISDKIDLKIKKITRDKEEHYIMIKGSISLRGRHNNCKYLCTQHRSTSVHKTNTDIKGEIGSNTIIVRDFNTPLTSMDRSSKQKINKKKKS